MEFLVFLLDKLAGAIVALPVVMLFLFLLAFFFLFILNSFAAWHRQCLPVQ